MCGCSKLRNNGEAPTIWILGSTSFSSNFVLLAGKALYPKAKIIGFQRSLRVSAGFDFVYSGSSNLEEKLSAALVAFPPNYIINLVGKRPPGSRDSIWYANSDVSNNLFNFLLSSKYFNARILTVGSAAEYLQKSGGLFSEDDPIGGVNVYGAAKSYTTNLVQTLYKKSELKIMIARPFNLIGPRLHGNGVVSDIITQVIGGNACVRVGDLTAIRDFVDVRDAARAYYLILNSGLASEVYNVCTGEGTSIERVVQIVERALGKSIPIIQDKNLFRKKEINSVVGENKKLLCIGEWVPKYSVDKTISEIVDSCK